MLEKLTLFVLLCYVLPVQAHPHSHNTETATKGTNLAPPISPAHVKQDDTAKLHSETSHDVNAQVRIVSTPNKDGYDKAAVWINLGLGIVGLAGIVVAICTLLKIKTQADEMTLQRKTMQDTLAEIKRQADLMDGQITQARSQVALMASQNKAIRDRERARLRIIFPPEFEPDIRGASRIRTDEGIELDLYVSLRVENVGISKAFGVRAKGNFHFQPKDSPFVEEVLSDIRIANLIRESLTDERVGIEMNWLVHTDLTDVFLDAKGDFYVYGVISYRDVFEKPHDTPFQFMWTMEEWNDTDGTRHIANGGWENQSKPST